jgi:pyruvate kinase
MRRLRNAKIVATLGPSSSDPAMIETLFRGGVDVFRLNFSHGTPADHRARMQAIRGLEGKVNRTAGPAGPKAAHRHVRTRARAADRRGGIAP